MRSSRYLFNLGPESGVNLADCKVPAHEYKRWNKRLTMAIRDDPDLWKAYVSNFMDKLLASACAAMNARTNLTIHFGVDDQGNVHGVPVEGLSLVLVSYICEPW